MSRSVPERHQTIQRWPSIGLNADASASPHRWTSTPSSSSEPNGIAARSAGTRYSTPNVNRSPHTSGSSGSSTPVGRCASNASSIQPTAQPVNDPPTDSCMLTATGLKPARHNPSDQPRHDPRRSRGLLEPSAVKIARSVLRGPRRSNAPGLPGGSASSGNANMDRTGTTSTRGRRRSR